MRFLVRQGGIRVTAIAAAFVVAQVAVSAHLELDKSHPADQICAVCAAVASLGAGNVAEPPVLAVVVDTPDAQAYVRADPFWLRFSHQLARGPPQAS